MQISRVLWRKPTEMRRSLRQPFDKPMKTPIAPLCWTGLVSAFLVPHLSAQTTYSWRAEATDGTWQLADNWWDGVQTATPGGSEILSFDNDAQPVMTNDLAATTRHRILFNSTLAVSRSIAGTTQNLFATAAANPPLVRNSSTVLHSLNFPILLDPTDLTVDADAGPLGLGGVISGSGGLLKTGANVLTLGAANDFTGKTVVTGGTVSIDADNRLGAAPGVAVADQLSLDNGTLRITGAASVTLNANRGIALGAAGGTLDNASMGQGLNANFNQIVSGNGPLALRANGNTSDTGGGVGGNLTLGSSANTFTGDVTIHSGVVNFAGDGSFGAAANDIVLAGGGLVATGARTLPATRDLVLSGGGDRIFRAYGGVTFTINGAITGSGNVRHTDGGTLQLNGNNSFTGNLIPAGGPGRIIALGGVNTYSGITHLVNGSTLRLDVDNALPDTTAVLLYGGTVFNVNGRTDTVRGVYVGGASDTNTTVNLGASGSTGTLTIANNSMPGGSPTNIGGNFFGKIAGFGNVEYNHATSDTANWDWQSLTNDFTGNVVITRGRLRTTLNGGIGSFGNAANDLVFNGDIVTTLGNGQGKASLQGASSGALSLGIDRSIVLNSGKEGTIYVWSGNTYTIDGQVTGGGNLRKEDGGVLVLTNTTNNYSGQTRIAQGTLRLTVAGVLPDASAVEIAGGNLDLNATTESVDSLFGTGGAVNGGGTLTVLTSGSADYAGAIQNGTTLRMSGTGTQTLSGTGDNANGWARIDSGTLVMAKASSLTVHAVGRTNDVGLIIAGGTARLAGTGNDQIYFDVHVNQTGGVFDFNGTNEGFRALTGTGGIIRNDLAATTSIMTVGENSQAADSYTYAGSLADGSGTMALEKVGAGTQVLSGTSTHSGPTTVTAGRLLINGSITASPVGVAAGGTLGGSGAVGTAVTVAYPGVIAPGSNVGTLTLASCVLDGVLEIELDGATNDRLDVTGTLDIGSADVSFKTPGAGATQQAYIIASYGTLVGTEFFTEIDLPAGYAIDYDYQSNKQIAIVSSGTPFSTWATAKGLTAGNNQPGDDPDKDGVTNLAEFAFDDEPLSGATSGKIVAKIETISGSPYLTLTLPVRDGAVFSGPGDLVSAPVAGVTYTIQGSTDLADFASMNLVQVTPALGAGLPALTAGWSYRTFRTPDPTGSLARQFIRALAE
jgi:autotransporter-associated beta strand protein